MDSLKIADLNRDIVGADRGINVAADNVTADGVRLNQLWNDFQGALDEWNQGRQALSAVFAGSTTERALQVPLGGNPWDFEKESEFGVAQSGRAAPSFYRMGLPYDGWDGRISFTRKFLRDATAEQVNTQFRLALEADDRLVFMQTVNALTTPRLQGSRLTNEDGISIYSLYAGSNDDLPPRYAGRTFSANHNHYLTTQSVTLDGADLNALTTHIKHHGFGDSARGEAVVILVHPNEGGVIRTFRRDAANLATHPDDFIPSDATTAFLTAENIVGEKPPTEFAGLPIIGSYGGALISESYFVPSGYLIATSASRSGSAGERAPLAFREHVQAVNRGLIQIPGEQPNDPLTGSTFWRGFGVGVRNRGAAAVMQITASSTYTAPTWTP